MRSRKAHDTSERAEPLRSGYLAEVRAAGAESVPARAADDLLQRRQQLGRKQPAGLDAEAIFGRAEAVIQEYLAPMRRMAMHSSAV